MLYEFIPFLPPFGIVLLFENPAIALTLSSLFGSICEILLFNFRPVLWREATLAMTATQMFILYVEMLENCCVHAQDRYRAQPPIYLMVTGA